LSETNPSFLNRRAELAWLRSLLQARRSALVYGPAGIGKTAVLKELAASQSAADPRLILAGVEREPGRWLRGLLAALLEQASPSPLRHALGLEAGARAADVRKALGRKSAGAMRTLLARTLSEGQYTLALDPTFFLSLASYELLRDLSRTTGTPMIYSAYSAYMDDIGYAAKFALPRDQRLALVPLGLEEMAALFDARVRELARLPANLEMFREHALTYARGNPGTLLGLLRLANEERYWAGENLKIHLLTVDFNLPRQGWEARPR
jgi:hypothetical protein